MRAKSPEPAKAGDVELRPDGWDRFEKAVDAAVKTPVRRERDASASKPTAITEGARKAS
jgi:hypothetical protein